MDKALKTVELTGRLVIDGLVVALLVKTLLADRQQRKARSKILEILDKAPKYPLKGRGA